MAQPPAGREAPLSLIWKMDFCRQHSLRAHRHYTHAAIQQRP